MKKLISILVAFAMMASLCVAMAFAADPVPEGTAQTAKLVKYLQAGEGVEVPEGMTFNFTLTPIAGNPADIDTVEVAIPVSGMTKDANGDYIGSKTIAEIFTGVTFPKAGEYKFTADEVATTWTAGNGETLVEDQDTFEVHLYVKNDGTGTSIDKVTVSDGTDKVDPTEIHNPADDGQDETGKNKGFSFTNTFKKDLIDPDQGQDEQDKTGVIDVTKTVTGNYADKTYEFPFELTYELPAANQGAVKYKVLKKSVTNAADVEEQTATGGKITFALADGDKLIITQAPQGTKWATLEKLADATCQNADKYQATANGTAFEEGANASTEEATLTEIGTQAAYENTLEDTDVTPTGVHRSCSRSNRWPGCLCCRPSSSV